MIGQMAKVGARADAVSFARELYKESHGEFGIMTGFQEEGPVAFAWVTYPLRANTNYGLLLLNGQPRIVNVEDLKLLDVQIIIKAVPNLETSKANFLSSMSGSEIVTERYGRTPKSVPKDGSSSPWPTRCATVRHRWRECRAGHFQLEFRCDL